MNTALEGTFVKQTDPAGPGGRPLILLWIVAGSDSAEAEKTVRKRVPSSHAVEQISKASAETVRRLGLVVGEAWAL
jgi:hypothetical protein